MLLEAKLFPFVPNQLNVLEAKRKLAQIADFLVLEDGEFLAYERLLIISQRELQEATDDAEKRIAKLKIMAMKVSIYDHICFVNERIASLERSIMDHNFEVLFSVRVPSDEVFKRLGLEELEEYRAQRNRFY